MKEKPDKSDNTGDTQGPALDATGGFFSVGAPLHPVRPGYIRRDADKLLYASLWSGHYAHVIAPDRTGKSSLVAATSARLQYNGVKVAVIDLAQIGERDGGSDPGRWYYSIAYRILRQLRLKVDLQNWWQDKSMLSNRQRLVEFYIEIVLQHVKKQVVIFIDELQCVEYLPFAGDLLASIRAAHNARTTDHELTRLSFALVCECDPGGLVSDERLSPFSISEEIHLRDFLRSDLDMFATELNLSSKDASTALDRIFYWTNGQPYLSQKLARSVSREQVAGDIAGHVDRIAMQQIAGRAALHSEPHMSHVHRQIVRDRKYHEALLSLYGRIRKGLKVEVEANSLVHRRLVATGLIVIDDAGGYGIRNRLYQRVFTARWANENLPIHWRGPAVAVATMLALTAIPFAYTQLLPRPYMKAIFSPSLEMPAIQEAYLNLRSFPGHADTADRVYESVLIQRAELARDPLVIAEIDQFARSMPRADIFADGLVADFWDRQVVDSVRSERRDAAIVASLQSLRVSTPVRRRTAASLIGEDYRQLVAAISATDSERLVFNPEHALVSSLSGAEVSQWALTNGDLEFREPWTLSALEITPMVRRVVVDRAGQVRRLGLTVNVGHGRLDDLRLKLIAPSGRTAELAFDRASSSEAEEIRFSQDSLKLLVGESVSGTWSLSLRDEATGVTGHLIGWNLRLDSQVVVENFERGLDIPDPVARESDDIWLSGDGRYAVARAQQSDSARLWDLAFAQPARTIAIPASEEVLGLSANAQFLITASQDAINRWRIADGRRAGALEVGAVSADARLSMDGNHLFVLRQQDMQTNVELWSIESREKVANLGVAGDLALVAIDAGGEHLAIADYDRAVRIWHFRSNELLAQIDLNAQPTAIELSANGGSLAVVHGEQGISLWRRDQPAAPVLLKSSPNNWAAAFSPSGERFIVGNSDEGYQVHRSSDGAISGPLLDSGLQRGADVLFGFSEDENHVVTARAREHLRLWHVPPIEVAQTDQHPPPGSGLPSQAGNSITAISPGARQLAIGDALGHVHIIAVGAGTEAADHSDDQLSYLGHGAAVVAIVFSDDGSLVASAAFDGTVRVWETDTGLPRPFFGGTSTSTVGQMVFSPTSRRLAVLSGLRAWIMDTGSGALIADVQLGENHSGFVFADDSTLYLASDSGILRSVDVSRSGGHPMRNVWASELPLQRIAVSRKNQHLVVVDATNTAKILSLRDGRVGQVSLQLPGPVYDIEFSPGESRVLFKTAQWIHRASVSPAGLVWLDAIRAPISLTGSRMVFDNKTQANPFGDRVMLLTPDAGFAKVAHLNFGHTEGPTLIGNRLDLLDEWRGKLMLPAADVPATAVEPPL